jgi:LmbE family N-acetylglucosaminyl deacetylase
MNSMQRGRSSHVAVAAGAGVVTLGVTACAGLSVGSSGPEYRCWGEPVPLSVLESVRPDVLYVPFANDLHRDHRDLFQSLAVAWRPVAEVGWAIREVYAYEVPSATHLGAPYLEAGFVPNTWVDITEHLGTKLAALKCYESQLRPFPQLRSLPTVEALARFRGAQMGAEAAEAFVLLRHLDRG